MRINHTENQKINMVKVNKKSKIKSTSQEVRTDKISISNRALNSKVITEQLKNIPDVRKEKIGPIKEQLAKGTYKVSPEVLAKKLLENIK